MRKLSLVCVLLFIPACLLLAPAVAAAADPSSNFVARPSCTSPAACLAQAIWFLDQARAHVGEPAYRLPGDFTSLDPAQQAFVLTDLDRVAAGLRPIPGLSTGLDQAAAGGVRAATDPTPTGADVLSFASDWAGGYMNMPFAYEAWMYDDGPGSGNLDCTSLDRSGCWQHRHDILFDFGSAGPLAMGAAAGIGPGGVAADTALLAEGGPGYNPTYTYTWSDALAAGAGGKRVVALRLSRRARVSCTRRRRQTRDRRHRRSRRCRTR